MLARNGSFLQDAAIIFLLKELNRLESRLWWLPPSCAEYLQRK